ncbi:MAG: DNA/RNA nuclease SfsA [Gammaproteobacteria bacterium]|nr:DNA/RNA nuclease SfsA [Gammaproteobacteria bacterium]
MEYPPLHEGRLLRRYKRFLADVELENGEIVTAHCPNTGSMRNCCEPGSRVWLYDAHNPKRKLRYTWELVEVAGCFLACINTQRANYLVKEAIQNDAIEELTGYDQLFTERRYGQENSRIDLLLTGEGRPDCYVEVKNLTLLQDGAGSGVFPDAVTQRGRKHLRELMDVVRRRARAVLFFNVAHTGIIRVAPAWDIDPEYASTLAEAMDSGVEVVAYKTAITPERINLEDRLEFTLYPPE